MSVINKMLKDLDERGQLKPPITDDTHDHNHGNQADAALMSAVNVNHQALAKAYGAQLTSAQAKKPWSLIVLGTIALVLMLGAAWMGMRLPGLMQGTPQSAAPESLASSESLPAA
ncbi:MAG: hypothetical protein ACRCT7_16730, partial [Shewanella sp.]